MVSSLLRELKMFKQAAIVIDEELEKEGFDVEDVVAYLEYILDETLYS